MARILVVDDDKLVQDVIADALRRAGHTTTRAFDCNEAIQQAHSSLFDLAIVDLRLPGPDGMATFRLLRRERPGLLGILITGFPEYPTGVVEAIHDGFADYIEKPFRPPELVRHVEATLARGVSGAAHAVEEVASPDDGVFEGMVGVAPPIREVFDLIAKVAATDEPVLVCGETGTGKELVARAIHRRSQRSSRALRVLNCATAGPDSLLESELFGHERGAFTGATGRVIGWFETAHGGTLFLDEVSELSHSAQAKLLRAIEHHEISRLGGHQPIHIDVRLIAATNVNLRKADVPFRKDLFHRLCALEITLPPLRERIADLPRLVRHFLPLVSVAVRRPLPTVSVDAMRLLQAYPWPGNLRELQQELKKACLRSSGSSLTAVHFSERLTTPLMNAKGPDNPLEGGVPRGRLREAGRKLQREWVEQTLARTGGNVSAAARLLGLSRRTIQRLIPSK